jgi:hypothetical protein
MSIRTSGAWACPDVEASPSALTPRSAAPPFTTDLRDVVINGVSDGAGMVGSTKENGIDIKKMALKL